LPLDKERQATNVIRIEKGYTIYFKDGSSFYLAINDVEYRDMPLDIKGEK